MGDAADDLYEIAMRWHDERKWCEAHQCWYLDWCDWCHDGEPPVSNRDRK